MRPFNLSRQQAEFIVDACEANGALEWMELAAEIREHWGMGPYPAGSMRQPVPTHLREDALYLQCSACGRKTWDQGERDGNLCNMPQPDGSRCSGVFRSPVNQS